MRTDTTSATSAIFAANRARGSVTFDVHQVDGVTRRRHLHESGSLRVRFPSPEAEGLSAVFVNTAGGIAGGDRFDIDIAAGEGSRLAVTTAAAEKIYRAEGPAGAAQYRLEGSGRLASRLAAAGDHSVRPGAGVAPDRYRSGGKRLAPAVRNRGVRPRRDGRANAAGANSSTAGGCGAAAGWCSRKPSGSTATSAKSSARPAIAKGGVAIGTALIVPGDEALVERIREAVELVRRRGRHLRWNGFAMARFCAQDAARLRADMMAVLGRATGSALPRLWLN